MADPSTPTPRPGPDPSPPASADGPEPVIDLEQLDGRRADPADPADRHEGDPTRALPPYVARPVGAAHPRRRLDRGLVVRGTAGPR